VRGGGRGWGGKTESWSVSGVVGGGRRGREGVERGWGGEGEEGMRGKRGGKGEV